MVNGADAEKRKAENHEAMGSVSGPCGMASRTDWDGANAALGNVFASVPESTIVDVYNSESSITNSASPAYPKSLVNGADAEG